MGYSLLVVIIFSIISFYIYWRFFFFFRDPERIIPEGENIVSPADGTVVYIKKVKNNEVPISIKKGKIVLLTELSKSIDYKAYNEWYVMGIFMHPTSVHVNRAPVGGTVSLVEYNKSKNFPMTLMWLRVLFKIKPLEQGSPHVLKNERNTILIKSFLSVYVIQIADIYVNKIVSYVKKNDVVKKGQRIGMIKFGSQVDLVFPIIPHIKIEVEEGEKVKAGESVVARLI